MPSSIKRIIRTFTFAALAMALSVATPPAATAQSTPVGLANLADSLLLDLPCTDNLDDASTNQLPVKVHGNVTIDSGAAYFPGGSDWLELPNLPFNQPFAISLAIKPDADGACGLIEQRQADKVNEWFHIMLRYDMQPHLGFYVNDALSPQSIKSGEWTRLVFQYTGTHQEIWVNGRLLCSRQADAYAGTRGATLIGKNPGWYNVPAHNFKGCLNRLRIYGRALTAEEIGQLAGLPPGFADATQPPRKTVPATGATNAAPPVALNYSSAVTVRPPPPFLSIEGNRLTISGTAGEIYLLQAANSLMAPWEYLATLTNQTGLVNYTDEDAVNHSQRFYRVEVNPPN